jgi:hypothetical protein
MNILILFVLFILLILITVVVIGGGIYTTNKDKFDPTKSLFENMLSVLTPPKDDSEVQSDESVVEETIEPPKPEPIVEAMIDDDEPAPVTEDGNVLSPVGGPPPSIGEIAKTVPVFRLIEDESEEPEEPEEKPFQPDWLNMDGTFKNDNYYRDETLLGVEYPYMKPSIRTASGNYLTNMEQQPCDYLVTNYIDWVTPKLETSEVERIVQSCNAGCKTPFYRIRSTYDNYEGAYFIGSRCETQDEIRERRAKKIMSVREEEEEAKRAEEEAKRAEEEAKRAEEEAKRAEEEAKRAEEAAKRAKEEAAKQARDRLARKKKKKKKKKKR